MNEKYLLDTITDEVLVKLIDETLRIEKTEKNKGMKTNLFKIIPAAAAIALVIGLANILPALLNGANTDDDGTPGAYAPTEHLGATGDIELELFLPTMIEKTFFEERILRAIKDAQAFDQFVLLYNFVVYHHLYDVEFYRLDPNISARETNILLEHIRTYTNLTGADMYYMLTDNNLPVPKTVDPAYAHVRFGATENILLLDIEWHTAETWLEVIEKEFMTMSDEEIAQYGTFEEFIAWAYERLEGIKSGEIYTTRLINGKDNTGNFSYDVNDLHEIAYYFDPDGYFIWNVYPYHPYVNWHDENGEYQTRIQFSDSPWGSIAYSKSEYEILLREQIIPFCDDLLAKGLITQESYDRYTIPDPLEWYISRWF